MASLTTEEKGPDLVTVAEKAMSYVGHQLVVFGKDANPEVWHLIQEVCFLKSDNVMAIRVKIVESWKRDSDNSKTSIRGSSERIFQSGIIDCFITDDDRLYCLSSNPKSPFTLVFIKNTDPLACWI